MDCRVKPGNDSEEGELCSPRQRGAGAIDHVLDCERCKQHAEQARCDDIGRDTKPLRDARRQRKDHKTKHDDYPNSREQDCEQREIAIAAASEQNTWL